MLQECLYYCTFPAFLRVQTSDVKGNYPAGEIAIRRAQSSSSQSPVLQACVGQPIANIACNLPLTLILSCCNLHINAAAAASLHSGAYRRTPPRAFRLSSYRGERPPPTARGWLCLFRANTIHLEARDQSYSAFGGVTTSKKKKGADGVFRPPEI